MIETLDEHYERLRIKIAAMRAACRDGRPDLVRLSHARHQLMTASLARSRFLKEAVYPALLGTRIEGVGAALEALDADLSHHRVGVSQHISTWTPDRIGADWIGYRAASAGLMRRIEDRMRREQATLMPTLAALHAPTPA